MTYPPWLATSLRKKVARHGGYVNYCSTDLKHRYGEGIASPDQIWVQPPGTPSVGLSYLRAYRATGDRFYLEAAKETALALIHGQLKSGGWTAWIDFDPKGSRSADYLRGKGRGKNNSSLDDGQTQTATLLLAKVDEALVILDIAHLADRPLDTLSGGQRQRALIAMIFAMLLEAVLRIPMLADSRSLNLSNAVALVVYEAWRQNEFNGAAVST